MNLIFRVLVNALALHAVKVGLAPCGIVAWIVGPGVAFETVRFQIVFEDHPKSQLIAQIK